MNDLFDSENSNETVDRKTYVIDTSVLLSDPLAMQRFDEHHVVIPLTVIEELDKQKTRMDEIGANARQAIREIERCRVESNDGLREGLQLPSGGTIRIEANHVNSILPDYLDRNKPDNRILSVAAGISGIVVTKDTALRIKAAQISVGAQDYRADQVHVEEHWTGLIDVETYPDIIQDLHVEGQVDIARQVEDNQELIGNHCVILRNGPSQSALGRVTSVGTHDVTITKVPSNPRVFGVSPRDVRQTFALDLLLDPEVPCVSLMGMAGTGKTFLALAAGLEQVMEQNIYRRLSVYRPLVAVGRQEVGYLPGDLEDKLNPWMAAVHDNLYALLRKEEDSIFSKSSDSVQNVVDELIDRGQLELAAITYLRGRSITDEFVIVDEAQNLELSTLKVILTRMASGSKVVFCGDLSQVDNPYISPHGGMAALIETLKGEDLFGHITMAKGVRSPLAELAALKF